MAADVGRQRDYHRELFGDFYDWPSTKAWIDDLTEDGDAIGFTRLGLDQMGHLGPHGCDLVVAEILAATSGPDLVVCELGCGFGGPIRYVVDDLEAAGRRTHGIGVDLVGQHCAFAATIDASLGRRPLTYVNASATCLPLADRSVDAVFAAGSASHVADMAGLVFEAARVLAPGGVLACLEEVSLLRPGSVPAQAFIETHPPGVFFTTPLAERRAQLEAAAFRFEMRDLSEWATVLLGDRLRAMRLLKGTMVRVVGAASWDRIHATLEAARAEYASGALQPTLTVAVRSA